MDDHMHGMPGPGIRPHHDKKMMTHMTFFWGKNSEILFSSWPGTDSGMYALALIFVFALAFLVEWFSYCDLTRPGSNQVAAGLTRTFVHALRIGLAYMVMLAVMSFNIGIFIVAVAGHVLGFFFFGSGFFKKPSPETSTEPGVREKTGLPP
ncbi:hypothetical protein NMG60_11014538 [Bertholletia excelsa]